MPTKDGGFVAAVEGPGGIAIACTVQDWLAGKPPDGGRLDDAALPRLGHLMATLPEHGHRHPLEPDINADEMDTEALEAVVARLRGSLDKDMLPARSVKLLRAAQRTIEGCMTALGKAPEVWGPIHGDLHGDNIVLDQGELRPIDFAGLLVGHYMYDLGAAIAHIDFAGSAPHRSRALLEGYRAVRPVPEAIYRILDAFVTYAAITNLAWKQHDPRRGGLRTVRLQLLSTDRPPLRGPRRGTAAWCSDPRPAVIAEVGQ